MELKAACMGQNIDRLRTTYAFMLGDLDDMLVGVGKDEDAEST